MMDLKYKRIIGLLLFYFSFLPGLFADSKQFSVLPANDEKIYIHFDRPYYNAGETIWFKAYLINDKMPSSLSDEMFLQFEDVNGKVLIKKKYPVLGATVSGNINIADTLVQGYYYVRVITKISFLNDPEFQYRKKLFISNRETTDPGTNMARKALSLQFFPESGHLIDRIRTQVAFKATNENGYPVDVSGVIKSDSNTIVTSFSSSHDGIGKTSFTPHIADALFAEVAMNGIRYKFTLPVVEPSGIYLKVTDSDSDSGKVFEVTRSKKDIDLFDTIRMLIFMNRDTVFEKQFEFGNEQTLSSILKIRNLPSGILHFKVLNKNNVPVAERLSFVNNLEYRVLPELLFTKRDSSKRGENVFELKFRDSIKRSLSISITDFDAQEFSDRESIWSGLLLTAELKGNIFNPAFYLEADDELHRTALDNLMLTHGWTRYNWKKKAGLKIDTNKTEDHFQIMISGRLVEKLSEKIVSNGQLSVQMFTEDSLLQTYEVVVDNNGRFKIDSLLFFGSAKLFYSYTDGSGKRVAVTWKPDQERQLDFFSRSLMQGNNDEGNRNGILNENLKESPVQFIDSKYKQLSNIVLKTKLKRPEDRINEKYTSPIFRSTGKIILDNINRPYVNRSLDVVNYLLTNIRTISFDAEYNSLVNKKNFSIQTQKNWIVALLVNENVTEIDNAKTITMDKVALIKFYEAGFVGVGTQAPGGAVAVYLKKWEDEQLPIDPEQQYIIYKGYDITQDFYSPDYTVSKNRSVGPDNRLTLYWESCIMDTDSSSLNFRFYNNDFSRKLKIVVEGFDANGGLIHYEKKWGE